MVYIAAAVALSGAALLVAAHWDSGPNADRLADRNATRKAGKPLAKTQAQQNKTERATRTPTRTKKQAPETSVDTAVERTTFDAAFEGAHKWLRTRQEARDSDDETAEKQARADWESKRRSLRHVRHDGAAAQRFLTWLGQLEDDRTALYLARELSFVFTPGFEDHLLKRVLGDGPELERRAAVVGLRGRGVRAATAVASVARDAVELNLRADATAELGIYIPDPHVIRQSARLTEIAAQNLAHEGAIVRRSALQALLAARRPLDKDQQAAAKKLLRDPDEELHSLARTLLKRNGVSVPTTWSKTGTRTQ